MAFYIYSGDSVWNSMMNTYMTLGTSLEPYAGPDGPGLLSKVSASKQPYLLSNSSPVTGTFSGTAAPHVEPLAPGELVLADEERCCASLLNLCRCDGCAEGYDAG